MKKSSDVKTKIEVVPYNSDWPKMFEAEKDVIMKALGENFVAIHHIGSTSVPGLAAKPKIDIIAVAKVRETAIANLKKAGYSYKGEWNIPLKCGFSKRKSPCDVNLHMFFDKNHPEIELNLQFRDYLIANSEVRDEYAQIKAEILKDKEAQEKIGTFPVYTIRKRKFIDSVLKKIGFNRLRVLRCITDNEWNIAKNFRQKYFFDKQKIEDPYLWTFANSAHEHFILYQGVEIIGYAHIQLWPELKKSALRMFVLEEEHLNKGFGSYFLSIIEQFLNVHSYKSLHIMTTQTVSCFYKKHGYTEMPFNDPDEYENATHDIALGKILTSEWPQ